MRTPIIGPPNLSMTSRCWRRLLGLLRGVFWQVVVGEAYLQASKRLNET